MTRLTEQEKQEIIRVPKELSLEDQQKLPGMAPEQKCLVEWEEMWTGDFVFENEWQSFRTKKDRSLELKSVFHECKPGRRKIALKVVDIFGNDTMTIIDDARRRGCRRGQALCSVFPSVELLLCNRNTGKRGNAMPRPPRIQLAGAHYHVVTRGDDRRQLFHDAGHYERFTRGLEDEVQRNGWIVLAYCWMPNLFTR